MKSQTHPSPWVDSPFLRSLLAGALAGTTVDLSLYPIDTLKTRLQSRVGFTAAGGFNGIYKGIGSAFIGSAPGAALFFVTYDSTKRFLLAPRSPGGIESIVGGAVGRRDGFIASEPFAHMLAASLGEIAACAVRVPTEVIKQRAQAVQHPSSLSALQHILAQRHTHGISAVWRELYRGWSITIMREVPFTVIQFPLWEALKQWRMRQTAKGGVRSRPISKEVPALESAAFGSIAGAIAAGVTTPLDVLKTRMMLSTERRAMIPLLREILRESGARAFFAGIGPRVAWISAGGAVFLGSYQWAINALGGEG
ncbi:mitochondrial carrier [Rhizodiscina lignyota]|uniref:Mitochondrial carrier n=1 Tax=Rhizodiscina lignyota TaxID=1504668 RepID=A0A9P4IA94_9PEZI|nr:mitochondrial carrier [Rhizodiscina lignyota]